MEVNCRNLVQKGLRLASRSDHRLLHRWTALYRKRSFHVTVGGSKTRYTETLEGQAVPSSLDQVLDALARSARPSSILPAVPIIACAFAALWQPWLWAALPLLLVAAWQVAHFDATSREITLHYDLDPAATEAYVRLYNALLALSSAQRFWWAADQRWGIRLPAWLLLRTRAFDSNLPVAALLCGGYTLYFAPAQEGAPGRLQGWN